KDNGSWKAWGVMQILDMQNGLRQYAGPGHWNDPDMLEVGNGGLSTNENRAHFSIWAMLAAPLIAGNDLRNMSPQISEILTNKEVISVNQDPLGIQGYRFARRDSIEIWIKPLENDNWAVCFLNRGRTAGQLRFDWQKELIKDSLSNRVLNTASTTFTLKDLWLKKQTGDTRQPLDITVPGHDVIMYRLSKRN